LEAQPRLAQHGRLARETAGEGAEVVLAERLSQLAREERAPADSCRRGKPESSGQARRSGRHWLEASEFALARYMTLPDLDNSVIAATESFRWLHEKGVYTSTA
jgi:hypothetical protein